MTGTALHLNPIPTLLYLRSASDPMSHPSNYPSFESDTFSAERHTHGPPETQLPVASGYAPAPPSQSPTAFQDVTHAHAPTSASASAYVRRDAALNDVASDGQDAALNLQQPHPEGPGLGGSSRKSKACIACRAQKVDMPNPAGHMNS